MESHPNTSPLGKDINLQDHRYEINFEQVNKSIPYRGKLRGGQMLFLIILILSFIAGLFLPWWAVAIVAFLAALFIGKTSGRSFLAGFGGIFIAWTILALIKSIPNDNMLAKRVTQLFQLPNWILILLITALIGGLVGGMSALSGLLVKKIFKD